MGQYHIDDSVSRAIAALNDQITSFEQATGRNYTLLFLPHSSDEKMHVSVNGHTVADPEEGDAILDLFRTAILKRIMNRPPGTDSPNDLG